MAETQFVNSSGWQDDELEMIDELEEITHAPSKSYVIRQAVRFMHRTEKRKMERRRAQYLDKLQNIKSRKVSA